MLMCYGRMHSEPRDSKFPGKQVFRAWDLMALMPIVRIKVVFPDMLEPVSNTIRRVKQESPILPAGKFSQKPSPLRQTLKHPIGSPPAPPEGKAPHSLL